MSILDQIPPAELTEIVQAAANDPHADTTPNGLALRWCVAKLTRHEAASQTQADTSENAAIEQLRAEVAQLRNLLQQVNTENARVSALVREKDRALRFANERIVALTELAEQVGKWDNALGTPAYSSERLQDAYHKCAEALRKIEAEERKP